MNSSTMSVRDATGRRLSVLQVLDDRGELAAFELEVNGSITLDLHDAASLAGFLSPAGITLVRRPR